MAGCTCGTSPRVNGISYCGNEEQVQFLKTLAKGCGTKDSEEVEGATIYYYTKDLGKVSKSEKGKTIQLKVEAQVKDKEEYSQCQDMMSKCSGFQGESASVKKTLKKPTVEKDAKEKWMKWATSSINDLQKMQAKFEDLNEKVLVLPEKPWWAKSMENDIAKQNSSISDLLQKIIKMKAIANSLQPETFQEQRFADVQKTMANIKKDFDDNSMPYNQVKTLVATFST